LNKRVSGLRPKPILNDLIIKNGNGKGLLPHDLKVGMAGSATELSPMANCQLKEKRKRTSVSIRLLGELIATRDRQPYQSLLDGKKLFELSLRMKLSNAIGGTHNFKTYWML
jgi:hypothetical protein